MQELMVLSNPRRRRGKRRHKARARRRGHRKMSALQLKYFGGGRRHKRRARRRSAPVFANPVRRRSSRRRVRRNPAAALRLPVVGRVLRSGTGSLSHPLSMVGPALTGAVGAVAVSAIAARLPLPAALVAGKTRYLTQGALAIGFGMIASRVGFGGGVAAKMAEGSLTVTLAEAIKELAGDAGLNLGGMGYYLPAPVAAMPPAGGRAARQVGGMGRYLTGPGSNVTALRRGMGNISTSFGF